MKFINNENVTEKSLPRLVREKRRNKNLTLQNLCDILNKNANLIISASRLSDFERSKVSKKMFFKYHSLILNWYLETEFTEPIDLSLDASEESQSSNTSKFAYSFKSLRIKLKISQAYVAERLIGKSIKYNQSLISMFERNLLSDFRMRKYQSDFEEIYESMLSECPDEMQNCISKPSLEKNFIQQSILYSYLSPPYTPGLFSDIINPATPCDIHKIHWENL